MWQQHAGEAGATGLVSVGGMVGVLQSQLQVGEGSSLSLVGGQGGAAKAGSWALVTWGVEGGRSPSSC